MPHEVIPYRSLSYAQLRDAYDRHARDRGLPPLAGKPSRMTVIERLAILKTRPLPKPKAPTPDNLPVKSKTPIQDMCQALLCEVTDYQPHADGTTKTVGHAYPHIVSRVRRKFRKSRASIASCRKIASMIRSGELPGVLPDIRLTKPRKQKEDSDD